ncbi:MAG: chorismate synthase [Lachnospiraceae bacterium]|nr:chorismate synthase [Lachnospira sp.]MBR6698276.1 chorismate synthase [Lachnospiraceae bacterium]
MAGSVYGNIFKVSTWGESHGKGVGVVVDGCPAGLALCEEDIQVFLDRRKPGQSKYTTARNEADKVEILSGVFEGVTTGTPISMVVYNTSQRSGDYSEIASYYRPGHADYTFDMKYGFRDYRGGGRSSGRETIARVCAGAVAIKILKEMGIEINAYSKAIGGITIDKVDMSVINDNPFYMPDEKAAKEVAKYADEKLKEMNSMGGIIECVIKNVMPGIGQTVFDKLDANLAKAIMSIGAVKGFEIGAGFNVAHMTGKENNDEFTTSDNGDIIKKTNNAGGILGGMSDGSDIIFRAAIKPTPSIAMLQNTVNKSKEDIEISIKGRHDPMIVPRAVVVVETMAAIALVDMIFEGMTSKMENVIKFVKNL